MVIARVIMDPGIQEAIGILFDNTGMYVIMITRYSVSQGILYVIILNIHT